MIGELPHFADLWPAFPVSRKLFYNRFYDLTVLLERLLMLTAVINNYIQVVILKLSSIRFYLA
jgi:hypothetical protein